MRALRPSIRDFSRQSLRAQSAASVRRALEHSYRKGVQDYEKDLAVCREHLTRANVHRLRGTIRRLLALLEVLALAQREPPGVEKGLRRQLKALGPLRDAQIQKDGIRDHLQPGPARALLRKHLHHREYHLQKAARHTLDSNKPLHRLRDWRCETSQARPRLVARLQRLIDERLQETFDPLGGLLPGVNADIHARHKFRVAARKFRDLMRALPESRRKGHMARLLLLLRTYQRLVGSAHDDVVFEAQLENWLAGEAIPSSTSRPWRTALRRKKRVALSRCGPLEREIFHAAMLALRELRLPANRAGRQF